MTKLSRLLSRIESTNQQGIVLRKERHSYYRKELKDIGDVLVALRDNQISAESARRIKALSDKVRNAIALNVKIQQGLESSTRKSDW